MFDWLLTWRLLNKILNEILINNLMSQHQIIKAIRGVYVEFNEMDPKQLPYKISEELPGFDSYFRFGKTQYHLYNYYLIIRLNVAVVRKTWEDRKVQVRDTQEIKDYFQIVTHKMDFFEQIFNTESFIAYFFNKIEVDRTLLGVGQELTTTYSKTITISLNYHSLVLYFRKVIDQAKAEKDPIKKINLFHESERILLKLNQYFLFEASINITEQLQQGDYEDMFLIMFQAILAALRDGQPSIAKLQDNQRYF